MHITLIPAYRPQPDERWYVNQTDRRNILLAGIPLQYDFLQCCMPVGRAVGKFRRVLTSCCHRIGESDEWMQEEGKPGEGCKTAASPKGCPGGYHKPDLSA